MSNPTGTTPVSQSRATHPGPTHEHLFNDDLLINGDLDYAKSQFPLISHVLDNPRLREKFGQYEEDANRGRNRVRLLGLLVVGSVTLALLVEATKPLWQQMLDAHHWTRWLALALELSGLAAALIAAGGLWLGPSKRRWLESRVMTERLRQWHFQLLVRRGQQIEASRHGRSGMDDFQKERSLWLDHFLKDYEGKLDAQVEMLVHETGPSGTWLHDRSSGYADNSAVLEQVFAAYQQLRFDHQYNYAVYKLRKSTDDPPWHFLSWPAICQVRLLSALTAFFFGCALIFSVILAYAYAVEAIEAKVWQISTGAEEAIRTAAIAVALIGAALRTLQEGLAPDEEIERYNDYRGRMSQLRDRFAQTTDPKERLYLMEEMELAAVDEMKGFLRTHHNATFVLT